VKAPSVSSKGVVVGHLASPSNLTCLSIPVASRSSRSLPIVQIPFEYHQITLPQLLQQLRRNNQHILVGILRRPESSDFGMLISESSL